MLVEARWRAVVAAAAWLPERGARAGGAAAGAAGGAIHARPGTRVIRQATSVILSSPRSTQLYNQAPARCIGNQKRILINVHAIGH